ncbi:MAG: YfcE family phosphodiesterase [Clostridia bacterium]|nr:YfcE family phosphodiesterase [Clostridia bacterium]
MKKILVVSDIHGNREDFCGLVESNQFDFIFFLGDLVADVQNLGLKNLHMVRGNWDIDFRVPVEAFVDVEGVKIMLTHGHKYGVKSGIGGLIKAAKQENCNLVCYGHTHIQDYVEVDGIGVLNPGAFSSFKGGKITYAIVEIDDKKINVNMLKNLK